LKDYDLWWAGITSDLAKDAVRTAFHEAGHAVVALALGVKGGWILYRPNAIGIDS
jgi:hypothetical protein